MPILKYKNQNGEFIPISAFKGDRGLQGDKGDSISNIQQTVVNSEEGGQNIITFTLTNGLTFNASIYNGRAYDDTEIRGLLSKKASTTDYTATFLSNGWSTAAPYTQTVGVQGILLTDVPIVDIDLSSATTSDAGTALKEAWNFIDRVTAENGTVTAYCYEEKPTIDVPIVLKVVR